MNLVTYSPPPPLADFVELFWISRQAPAHAKERILPGATMELVISLRDGGHGPLISGAHSEHFVIDTAEQAALLGVHFKPGGAFPFLNLPAGDLHNAVVSLDTLWGRQAGALHERLLEAGTPAAKFRVLEEVLLARAARPLARHPAVAFALKEFDDAPHARTMAVMTDRIGLSPRRFIEAFTEEVGLTPKLYCRILRFHEVVRRVHRMQRVDWTDVALGCGYYDQSHFIRDFRAFSGLNPSEYLHVRGDHLFHVPIDEKELR